MKNRALHIVFLLIMLFCASALRADIGETYSLKVERSVLVKELQALRADSLRTDSVRVERRILSIEKQILSLDERIFRSYDQSIDRMAAQKQRYGSNGKLAVYLAMVTTVLSLLFAIFLLLAHGRLLASGNGGLVELYRQLSKELVEKVSAEQAASKRMLRVHLVVVFGLIVMSISVVAFLVSTL